MLGGEQGGGVPPVLQPATSRKLGTPGDYKACLQRRSQLSCCCLGAPPWQDPSEESGSFLPSKLPGVRLQLCSLCPTTASQGGGTIHHCRLPGSAPKQRAQGVKNFKGAGSCWPPECDRSPAADAGHGLGSHRRKLDGRDGGRPAGREEEGRGEGRRGDSVHTHAHMCTHMHTHVYTHMNTQVYTHAHTHEYTSLILT